MKIKLKDEPATRELLKIYPQYFTANGGIPCSWKNGLNNGYRIDRNNGSIAIRFAEKSDLFMALGDIMSGGGEMGEKTAPFKFRGIMLDASRNAVMKVDYLKERLAQLALLGLNYFCLYTEDTYRVPGEPLFGYARGGYSQEEIKELVRYGKMFGITLFPCIQTLGHMEQILKYSFYDHIKDNDSIYNVKSKDTYDFIEKTVDAAIKPYNTKLIHIGLDETFGLGRGKAFVENSQISPKKLYLEHLLRVVEICRKKNLTPIIWGDMLVAGPQKEYEVPKSVLKKLPKNLQMNYWEYTYCDVEKYKTDIAAFQDVGYNPVVSPGVWSWSRFFPAHYKGEKSITTMMNAARKAGVEKALNTHWGDDGHECFFDFNLAAHTLFLSHCTERTNFLPVARKKFKAVFGEEYDSVTATEKIDMGGYKNKYLMPYNIGKCFFYDDPAQGLFSGMKNVESRSDYYRELATEMRSLAKKKSMFTKLFKFAECFCDFLSVKSDLRNNIARAYREKNKDKLYLQLAEIKKALKKLERVKKYYRELWLKERSPFGLEIIEGRMGILTTRLEYLHYIIVEHLEGRMPKLDEFEFKNYSFFHSNNGRKFNPAAWPHFMQHYSALASRNVIKWW